MAKSPHMYRRVIITLVSIVGLFLLTLNFSDIVNWLSQASGTPANLVIDSQGLMGVMPPTWKHYAQGGEDPAFSLKPINAKVKDLEPAYIRLDHIYDYYADVVKTGDQLQVDWTQLDNLLEEITTIGAKPFLSLSYMPPAISSGTLTDPPQKWQDWQELVRLTIEHVSGIGNLNLKDVYYEVWNEPDLFGQWKTYGPKNYLTLYHYSAIGAQSALNVNSFKLGGPATTALYDNWHGQLLDFVKAKKLRFDFYSWHRYSESLEVFEADVKRFHQKLREYPEFVFTIEPVISEWGYSGDMASAYDTNVGAAHAVGAVIVITPELPKAFTFELMDGRDPQGRNLWGRWGLLTHYDHQAQPKPRYQALKLLNQMGRQRISVVGQGSWVKSLASRDLGGSIQILIANYDKSGTHSEIVPIKVVRMLPGIYNLTQTMLGQPPQTTLITVEGSAWQYQLPMSPNSVVFLELKPQE